MITGSKAYMEDLKNKEQAMSLAQSGYPTGASNK